MNREEIAQQALSLSHEDRAYVVEILEQSLSDGFATPEIAAAWKAEIQSRSEAYRRGELPAEDWMVVMARLEAKHCASKTATNGD